MSDWIKRVILSVGMLGTALAALVFMGSAAWAQAGSVPLGGPLAQPCVVPDDPFESPAVPCLAILQLAEGSTSDQRAAVALGAGAVVRHDFQFANAAAVFVPNELAFWSLVDDSQVLEFIPDRINHLFVKPEGKGKPKNEPTPTETIPSGVAGIGAEDVWYASITGSGIGVAIVDTGIDFLHDDLNDNLAIVCFSVTGNCQDEAGHGTHVAGIVAAEEGNDLDVAGVAPDATLYAVRVFAGNTAPDSDIMAGLSWIKSLNDQAVQSSQPMPIRVVNMSFGRPGTVGDNNTYRDLIAALANSGVVLVASAGNDPFSEISQMVPASYPEVMAVASTTALEGSNKCNGRRSASA